MHEAKQTNKKKKENCICIILLIAKNLEHFYCNDNESTNACVKKKKVNKIFSMI